MRGGSMILGMSIEKFTAVHVALSLSGRGAGALPERVRGGRAGVPKAAGPDSAGPHAIRAAVSRRAGRRPGDLRGARDTRRGQVPPDGDDAGLRRRTPSTTRMASGSSRVVRGTP